MLDDFSNFANLANWLNGDATWNAAVFDNASGPLRRPVAYFSFLLNTWVVGFTPPAFKVVNLILHIGCGFLIYALLTKLLLRVVSPSAARSTALAVAATWMLLPIHVSSVQYSVQRMTLLCGLFTLAGLLAYARGRALLTSHPRHAAGMLFLAFPICLILATLSKESGVILPVFALLVEVCFMTRTSKVDRIQTRLFFLLFLVLPMATGAAIIVAGAQSWLDYSAREFGLLDRLCAQPVILLEYLRAIVLPLPQWLHLYRDSYPATQLLPVLFASVFWVAWVGLGLALIQRNPIVAFGLLFFVVGHLVESTVFPLEFYFEHRNYVPSVGVVLVLVWVLIRVFTPSALLAGDENAPGIVRLKSNLALQRPAGMVLLCLIIAYTAGTAYRSFHWRTVDRLMATEGPQLPEISRRLQVDRAIRGFEVGSEDQTNKALSVLEEGNEGDRATAALWRTIFSCDSDGKVPRELLSQLHRDAPRVATHNHASYLSLLARRAERGACEGLGAPALGAVMAGWLDISRLPQHTYSYRQLRILRSRMALLAGEPQIALESLSNGAGRDFEGQLLHVQVLLKLGRLEEARNLIQEMQASDRGWYRNRTKRLNQVAASAR